MSPIFGDEQNIKKSGLTKLVFFEYVLDFFLTPKVLLSPIGTIWTSGRLVQFQFMLRFFEIFI